MKHDTPGVRQNSYSSRSYIPPPSAASATTPAPVTGPGPKRRTGSAALWEGRVVVTSSCLRCSDSKFWRNSAEIVVNFWWHPVNPAEIVAKLWILPTVHGERSRARERGLGQALSARAHGSTIIMIMIIIIMIIIIIITNNNDNDDNDDNSNTNDNDYCMHIYIYI